MKKLIIAMAVLLLLCGCEKGTETQSETSAETAVQTEASKESTTTAVTATETSVPEREPFSYSEAEDAIDGFMSAYIGKNSDENDVRTESNVVLDYSEEGGTVTCFFSRQTLLRCQYIAYGGMGKAEYNYYLVDGFGYYTVLNSMYDAYPLTKSQGEVLYYSFEEYCICGEEAYRIDRIGERLVPCGQSPVLPIILENINAE